MIIQDTGLTILPGRERVAWQSLPDDAAFEQKGLTVRGGWFITRYAIDRLEAVVATSSPCHTLRERADTLSRTIINAVRSLPQLHGSLFQAAKELAARADGMTGEVEMSYKMLGYKCHQSRRTALRHIAALLDLGIIVRQRFWGPNNLWGINKYTFVIRWKTPAPPPQTIGDIVASTLPNQGERKKFGTIREQIQQERRGLRFLTNPTLPGYQACLENLARLEALLL